MSKSDAFENDLLDLILNAVAIANVADDAATSPLTVLHVALHTADPGDAGNQTTNECAYTSYARVTVARDGTQWAIAGGVATLNNNIDFPEATGGTETATHFSLGKLASGAGEIIYSGTLTPNISITTGTIPRVASGSTITET